MNAFAVPATKLSDFYVTIVWIRELCHQSFKDLLKYRGDVDRYGRADDVFV